MWRVAELHVHVVVVVAELNTKFILNFCFLVHCIERAPATPTSVGEPSICTRTAPQQHHSTTSAAVAFGSSVKQPLNWL
ncbi:hypothetical protein ACLKA7_007423 [Drosophila subpalustris]